MKCGDYEKLKSTETWEQHPKHHYVTITQTIKQLPSRYPPSELNAYQYFGECSTCLLCYHLVIIMTRPFAKPEEDIRDMALI